jgi:hypothetical protein
VRYDEFRDAFFAALRDAGLRPHIGRPTETIDLTTTTRRWQAALGEPIPQRTEPFLTSATVSFEWDPVESARTYTTEEDLVTELLGRDEDPPETMPRLLRTDIVLRATLPYDSRVPMPGGKTWRSWSLRVDDDVASFLPTDVADHEGGNVLVMGARGKVEAESTCSEAGELCLSAVSLPSWQGVVPPRVRDAVDDDPEGDIDWQLEKLAERYRGAYDAWVECVMDLRDELGLDSTDD